MLARSQPKLACMLALVGYDIATTVVARRKQLRELRSRRVSGEVRASHRATTYIQTTSRTGSGELIECSRCATVEP